MAKGERGREMERGRERFRTKYMFVPLDTFTDKGELKSCLAIRTAYPDPTPSSLPVLFSLPLP